MGKGMRTGGQEAIALWCQYAFRFFQEYFHVRIVEKKPQLVALECSVCQQSVLSPPN